MRHPSTFCRVQIFTFLSIQLLIGLTGRESRAEDKSPNGVLNEYFRIQTEKISQNCLSDVQTAADWNAQKSQRRLELREMLGLVPWPEKSDLKPQATGEIERGDIVVEKLYFESLPGLYVTANFYRPKQKQGKLPTILYQCGHAVVKEKDVSFGNKVGYQHHGAWFAQNGYNCLTIDTIQLGEIEGIHHGTHRLGLWNWLNRGYTPAGVEAWNAIRALDYLETRDDVDLSKIGATGRSGGGAYTWYAAALDDRIQVAIPTAGITNMHDHVVEGKVSGHCDCMYMVNYYKWDYSMLAALIAPRPLLIVNTDRDSIFPLNGVVETHLQARRIYSLLDSDDDTGLFISTGGHKDSQHLQNAAFEWFNKYLKKDLTPITIAAEKLFQPAELKVFETLPTDERVTTVQDWFISHQKPQRHWQLFKDGLIQPDQATAVPVHAATLKDFTISVLKFQSEAPFDLPFLLIEQNKNASKLELKPEMDVRIVDQADWSGFVEPLYRALETQASDEELYQLMTKTMGINAEKTVYFAPRGLGRTAWDANEKEQIQIRRRFYLLGTSLDERRIVDTMNLVTVLKELSPLPKTYSGKGIAASWLKYTALNSSEEQLANTNFVMHSLPDRDQSGPFLLGIDDSSSLSDENERLKSRHNVDIKD